MSVERLPATATGPDVAAVLARDGCAIVERLVPVTVLDRARAELAPHLEATPVGPDLATASAAAYRNLAVYSNVAR